MVEQKPCSFWPGLWGSECQKLLKLLLSWQGLMLEGRELCYPPVRKKILLRQSCKIRSWLADPFLRWLSKELMREWLFCRTLFEAVFASRTGELNEMEAFYGSLLKTCSRTQVLNQHEE